jgi:hypothetical protein
MYMLIWTLSPNNNQWRVFETMGEAEKERKHLDLRTSAILPVSKRAEANLSHLRRYWQNQSDRLEGYTRG